MVQLDLYNFYTMRNIFISCGHNNARNWIKNENGKWVLWMSRDQGAVNPMDRSQTEYRWVRKISNALYELTKTSTDYKYIFVPADINLGDRIAWINKRAVDGDVCIELHMNSGGGNGTEVLAHAKSKYALAKASEISAMMASSMGLKNRWGKPDTVSSHGTLWIIRDTKPLAFLIELGFIDNVDDRNMVWMRAASSLKLMLWTIKF